jgi:hypothetical protein
MVAKRVVRASGRGGRWFVATGVLLPWVLSAGFAAAAQPDEEVGSTYARVRFVEQGLSIERPSEGDILAGAVNAALIPGDTIQTTNGRAEIELADTSILYLDTDTRLELRNLADYDNRYERTNLLALRQGAIRVDNREAADADSVFQVDTEAGSVYLLSSGSIRIEADGAGTTVASYSGVAEFSGDGGSVLVRSGQRAGVAVGAMPDEPRRFNTARTDGFDLFHDERVSAWAGGHGAPPEAEGVPVEVRPYVRELSYYGTWTTLAPYGVVWRPVFTGGWAPYAHGTWAYYPSGWVWVSYDPWGWAPYHYGRWDYVSSVGWFWVPGRVWSGAWVSFAVSTTHVGWCPLNYWNRPVFHDAAILSQPAVPVARLDPRGWQFVPVGRFGRGALAASRVDRLPRGTEVVVTRSLPAPLSPRAVAVHTEPSSLVDQVRRSRVALPAATTSSGEPVSFRVQEQRRAAASTSAPIPARPRNAAPRPAPAGTIPLPQATAHAPHPAPARPPSSVTTTRAQAVAPPEQPGRPNSHPQRHDPSAARRNDPSAAQRNETPAHDPAVGRLVGGARAVPSPPPAPAPASQQSTQAAPSGREDGTKQGRGHGAAKPAHPKTSPGPRPTPNQPATPQASDQDPPPQAGVKSPVPPGTGQGKPKDPHRDPSDDGL